MRKRILHLALVAMLLIPGLLKAQSESVSSETLSHPDWQPVEGSLTTPWTNKVNPRNVHNKYPRPQLQRDRWQNLNGLWTYKITSALSNTPTAAGLLQEKEGDGQILVPFPIESSLSGVKKMLKPEQKLWYQRSFTIPSSWEGQSILLHFGAVDWKTVVWVNGQKVGMHEGGFDPFTFDITDALNETGKQQVTVSVWDPSSKGFQPRGKQSLNPHGIWYTASSGIWQTVWLEPVSQVAVKDLKMVPDIDNKTLQLQVNANTTSAHYEVQAVASFDGKNVATTKGALGEKLTLPVNDMKLWSPQHPFLYDLKVTVYKEGEKIDEVQSYFGMRKISLGKDEEGITRLFLNNKPLFQFGPLDQGYWPDGLYTAPTDEAMKFDILKTKAWGFNMIRKHVKVEPRRWYYYCDKIGLLVWQDMPSGDKRISRKQKDIKRVAQSSHDFKKELKQMIDDHYNHPSIVTWVPFNEGWGQFQTKEVAQLVADLDPSRLVDAPSGWADRGVGDMHDLHEYPGPGMFPIEDGRASVLGEFGGQALVVKGHLWLKDFSKAPKHYKTSTSDKALHEKYASMIDRLKMLKKKGLSAAVYTQTTDVEVEVNGLMTYDREKMKFDEDELKEMNQEVIHEE